MLRPLLPSMVMISGVRPTSVIYTRQAPLEQWLFDFQHQLSDGGRHARPAVIGVVAALRELRALAVGAAAGHGTPKPHNVTTLRGDVETSHAEVGPELRRRTAALMEKVLASLSCSAPQDLGLQELIELVEDALRVHVSPTALVAGFDDAASAYRDQLPLDLCEQRMRIFAQQVAQAGHSYREIADTLAEALNDDVLALAELGADIREPTSLEDRDAGYSVEQRLAACRDGLRRPARSGAVVAWLIFEDAFLPHGYVKVGPLEFFSGRDYPASLRGGWWRPEGAPEELGDRWSELFLPESLPERECVLVRVQLAAGPLAGAAERATGLVLQALHMAYDRSQWKLMHGVALVRDGRWLGTRPRSTLDWPHFPTMNVIEEPTSHRLETLDSEVLEALASADARALDVAADREWLANVAELADPAHRVALTVRLLERRLHTMRRERWAWAVEHYFADWWAEEQILDALVDAAEVGIGALPDRWDSSPQLTLRFRELMLPWSSGLSFRIRPAEIIRNAAELAAHLPPGSFERRQIEEVVARTRTAADAAAWLEEIKRDFGLLIGRATRQRNAVLHGNDTLPEVVETVDPFLRRLASMLVDEHLAALASGRTLAEQLARVHKRARIRDERLAAGEEPAEILLQ